MVYFVKMEVEIKTFEYFTRKDLIDLISNALWEKNEFRNIQICNIEVDMPEPPMKFDEVKDG